MDELGNTHVLEPLAKYRGAIGNACMRLSNNIGLLSAWMADPGTCRQFNRPGGCRAGPVSCTNSLALWHEMPYEVYPPESFKQNSHTLTQAMDKPLDGLERSGFGDAGFWYLGRTVLNRRRRHRTPGDPFTMSTHRSFHRMTRSMDMFQYPGVERFVSGAELLLKLERLLPDDAASR